MIFQRKKFIVSLVAFIALVFYQRVFDMPSIQQGQTYSPQEVLGNQIQLSPTASPSATPTVTDTPQLVKQAGQVLSVSESATFTVLINNKKETVQAIGIAAPVCFASQASASAKQILTGQKVSLAKDPTQTDKDSAGKLLRYIFLYGGSIDFGEMMLSKGSMIESSSVSSYRYQLAYQEAQKEAQNASRGLWADPSCPKTSL
ncbi:MAG TPA: thermonuclease family protein [Methylomirabilota bacterium]|nr:thermonuclease family protein [Methylomirabilota bacterium]